MVTTGEIVLQLILKDLRAILTLELGLKKRSIFQSFKNDQNVFFYDTVSLVHKTAPG